MVHTIYDILIIVMLIISALIVISIFMQPSRQDGAADAFTGSSGDLFEQHKPRGFEAAIQRFTWVLVSLWMIIGFALVVLSGRQ